MVVGFGVGFPVDGFPSGPGRPGVGDGLGVFRFAGTSLGVFGGFPGTFPPGVCFGPGTPVVFGLPPGLAGEPTGVA